MTDKPSIPQDEVIPVLAAMFNALGSAYPREDRIIFDLDQRECGEPRSAMGRGLALIQKYAPETLTLEKP